MSKRSHLSIVLLSGARHRLLISAAAAAAIFAAVAGCTPDPGAEPEPSPTPAPAARWTAAFDTEGVGDLSSVWGSGPNDVFMVGGTRQRGEVYHFDGADWSPMTIPDVPFLVWVHGFGPDDVLAVGEDGAAIHFDGQDWTELDTGVDEALWGVWGADPSEVWVVGGDVGQGEPVILRYDGISFKSVPVPANDRQATSLFKVWGIGSKVFAVGEKGLILEFDGTAWSQVPAGAAADEDFVSLWGTSESNIVVVGGRNSARIAVYDGQSFSTQLVSGVPGLNAVFVDADNQAVVGGVNGYIGLFNPQTGELTREDSGATTIIHAAWADGAGTAYAVGGRFSPPHAGIALMRQFGSADDDDNDDGDHDNGAIDDDSPPEPECVNDEDCGAGLTCNAGNCEEAAVIEMELGFIDDAQRFVLLAEGGPMPLHAGFQGLSHMFATLRIRSLNADNHVELSWVATDVDSGAVISTFDRIDATLRPTGSTGVVLIADWFMPFTQTAAALDGKTIEIDIQLFEDGGPTLVELTQRVELQLKVE